MKTTIAAATLATALVAGTQAYSGGLSDPVLEQDIVEDVTTSSGSHDALVPIMFLLLVATAASS